MDLPNVRMCDHFKKPYEAKVEKMTTAEGFVKEMNRVNSFGKGVIYYEKRRKGYVFMCLSCWDRDYKIFKGNPYIEFDVERWPDYLFTDSKKEFIKKFRMLEEKTIARVGFGSYDGPT